VPAATLPAQDDASPTASATACYEWLAAPAYRRQIAAIRPLAPKMKMAFAAPGLGRDRRSREARLVRDVRPRRS